MRALVVWLVTAVAVAAAVWIVPGIDIIGPHSTLLSLIVLAGVLSLLNSFIKPILQLVSLPISCLTLGLFALVVNTFVLYLASWISNSLLNTGLYIRSFWSALGASVVISLVAAILNAVTGVHEKQRTNE